MNSTSTQLSDTFSALAHPVRREIIARLSKGHATVNEIAAPFDMSLPAVSKHIKVLQRAGIIEQEKSAQFRPCKLNIEPLREIANWVETYREIWNARFDDLDNCLKEITETENG